MKAANKLGIEKALSDWSLNDIRDFQADLEAECKSSLSEKWVYTHFKNEGDRLPRIDVLNLLSAYVGYKSWDEFLRKQNDNAPHKGRKIPLWVPLFTAMVVLSALSWILYPRQAPMVIVFKDAYTQAPIDVGELYLKINGQTMATASISSPTPGDTLLADGPYYKLKRIALPNTPADTFFVELLPDDYALMLNFFSRSTTDDLDKRRTQLLKAIHAEAKIFQSHPAYEGIELLNRDEFIDRLTLPINSLKNLEIQHILYKDEKIYRLQFLQKPDEDEND